MRWPAKIVDATATTAHAIVIIADATATIAHVNVIIAPAIATGHAHAIVRDTRCSSVYHRNEY